MPQWLTSHQILITDPIRLHDCNEEAKSVLYSLSSDPLEQTADSGQHDKKALQSERSGRRRMQSVTRNVHGRIMSIKSRPATKK